MSEQLWYTWSASGFGTVPGYRVRAATANLTDVESQRVRVFINLLGYTLSRDTDLYLPPQEAPLCLTFLKAGPRQEAVLIQKTYAGLDGLKRPGVFFSHLLTELPPVPSSCPGGQLPFSACEAINLWRSSLWRDTEQGFPSGKRDLEPIASTDLTSGTYAGPLNEQYVMSIPELFRSVLQAFLTLALSGERKRLYLAGSPDTVAALIWGITHALPRTLTIMQDLTFSTFESNIENDAKPLIVGTCWLPQFLKKGHENALLDLPAPYYQANNPYGIAIKCAAPQRQTPFTLPHPLVAKYSQFVLDCFKKGQSGMAECNLLLDKAEKRNISEVMDLLNHYTFFEETFSKEDIKHLLQDQRRDEDERHQRSDPPKVDVANMLKNPGNRRDADERLTKVTVTSILQNLHNRVEKLMTQAEKALQQDKTSTAAAEAAQMESIEADVEMLLLDNVQQSLINLMMQDHNWWQTQGQPLLSKLYGLTCRYSKEQLAQAGNRFLHTVTASKAWNKNQGADLIAPLQPLVPDYKNYAKPQELLEAFAKEIENRVLETQKALRKALLPLATSIVDQLVQAVQADQHKAAVYWSTAFKTCVDVPLVPTEVWASLLQHLSSGVRYTNTYKELWRQFCQPSLTQIRPYVRATDNSAIAAAFTAFATSAGQQLLVSIQADESTTSPFWGSMLATAAPPASEPAIWVDLLKQLAGLPYTAAYERWWKDYGKAAMKDILTLANEKPESEPGRVFSSFMPQLSSSLKKYITEQAQSGKQEHEANISFILDVLTATVPADETKFWLILLQNLSNTSPRQVLDAMQHHPTLFENVLLDLMKAAQTQPTAIQFFTYLVQQGYANSVPLLGKLLSASGYQKNIVEQLLAAAQISSNTDIVELLENHCQQMLANYELPPTMLHLIEQYFANFDVEYLDTDPTRTLLLSLQQREKTPALRLPSTIRQAVDGWYKIAEFLAQPQASRNSLRDLSHNLRDIKRLMEEQQAPNIAEVLKKLTTKLTPWLVKLVTTDVDLARVIDNLGRGGELQLLQEMAKVAGEQYGQERPPVRIFPYIRVILGEARGLQSPQKEAFIDSSFQSLFKHIDAKTRDKYLPEPTWPKAFTEEWNAYLTRLRSLNLNRTLNRFKEAASKPDIPALLAAYDHLLDPYLTTEEHRLVGLADGFLQAYTSDNDTAIMQAQEALKQYYAQPLYTREQAERIRLARQRIEQQQVFAQQQASAQLPTVKPIKPLSPTSGPSPSSTRLPNEAQAAPAASQGTVAVVRGQAISAAWLEWALPLRKPYTTERIDDILLEMQDMENTGEDRKNKQKYKLLKQEHLTLKKIQSDEKRLREATLYDLIQDIFIQEEIVDLVQRDASAKTLFDAARSAEQINRLYNKLRTRYQHAYPPLGSKDENTLRDVQKVLAMFVRREQLTHYLSQYRQIGLDEWWREQLQRDAANINIDYKQAGLIPPQGIRSRLGL